MYKHKRITVYSIITSKSFLITILVFILFASLLYHLSTITQMYTNFYNFILNPEQGAVVLEKEYKKNFDSAEAVRLKENQEIDGIQKNGETTVEMEDRSDRLTELFKERGTYFNTMIAIDNNTLNLRLPKTYKDFYIKRLAADKNDYDAFKYYSAKQSSLTHAIVAYEKFNDDYKIASNLIEIIIGVTDINPAHALKMGKNELGDKVTALNNSYQKVTGLADTEDIYSQGMLDYIQHQYDLVILFKQLNDAEIAHDSDAINKVANKMTALSMTKAPDFNTILLDWYVEKVMPAEKKQDDMHKKSQGMYTDTYLVAQRNHLQSILDVWFGTPPGIDNTEERTI